MGPSPNKLPDTAGSCQTTARSHQGTTNLTKPSSGNTGRRLTTDFVKDFENFLIFSFENIEPIMGLPPDKLSDTARSCQTTVESCRTIAGSHRNTGGHRRTSMDHPRPLMHFTFLKIVFNMLQRKNLKKGHKLYFVPKN